MTEREVQHIQNQINGQSDQRNGSHANFFSNKTASKMNKSNKDILELNYKRGVVLKKEMPDSCFAVSDVSLNSQESDYTESSMGLMKMSMQLGLKDTTRSQQHTINNVQSIMRVGSTIVSKPQ